MANINGLLRNQISGQGGKRDAQTAFTIDDAICEQLTPNKIRAFVASEAYPRKVVSYLPQIMADVNYKVEIAGTRANTNAEIDLEWISDQLKTLSPWLAQTQVEANIVGKAYLVFDVTERALYDKREYKPYRTPGRLENTQEAAPTSSSNEEIAESYDEVGNASVDGGAESVAAGGTGNAASTGQTYNQSSSSNYTIPVTVGPAGVPNTLHLEQRNKNVPPGTKGSAASAEINERFPLTQEIVWTDILVEALKGVRIVAADEYQWSDTGKYLYRMDRNGISNFNGELVLGENRLKTSAIDNWIAGLDQYLDNDKKVAALQFEAIESSHVIEIVAFDYQNDVAHHINRNQIVGDTKKYPQVSYRLTRFINAVVRYMAFINATLNRMVRSEFLAYKKKNMGDLNLDISRALAQMGEGVRAGDGPGELDTAEVLKAELERMADNAVNLGIVAYDADNDLQMIERNMLGLKELANVFKDDVVSSSGLTEFVLFGYNKAGTGLSSLEQRDRREVAEQTDTLWMQHWKPFLLQLARNMAINADGVTEDDIIQIVNSPSFKLSDTEMAEWLDKIVNARIELIKAKVLSPKMVLKELMSNGLLGESFVIDQDDADEHIKLLDRFADQQVEDPQFAQILQQQRAQAQSEKTQRVADDAGWIYDEAGLIVAERRQGDISNPRWKIELPKVYKRWRSMLNMTPDEIRSWARQGQSSKGKNHANIALSLLAKSVNSMNQSDYNKLVGEVNTLNRLLSRAENSRVSDRVKSKYGEAGLSPSHALLRNHGVAL